MTDMATFRRLFEFERWANDRQLSSLETTAELSEYASSLIGHIYAATDYWVAQLNDQTTAVNSWQVRPLAELPRLAERVNGRSGALLSRLDDAALEAKVSWRDGAGEQSRVPVSDILLHVLLHSSQHRGQLTDEIGRMGGRPAVTDYDEWWSHAEEGGAGD